MLGAKGDQRSQTGPEWPKNESRCCLSRSTSSGGCGRPRCPRGKVGVARVEGHAHAVARREMMPSEPPPAPPPLPPSFCFAALVTRFSFIRSEFSRPFFMSHLVTRPSDEIETRISPRSPWVFGRAATPGRCACRRCRGPLEHGLRVGLLDLAHVVHGDRAVVQPRGERLGCCPRAIAVTPHAVRSILSADSGFLSDRSRSARPSRPWRNRPRRSRWRGRGCPRSTRGTTRCAAVSSR